MRYFFKRKIHGKRCVVEQQQQQPQQFQARSQNNQNETYWATMSSAEKGLAIGIPILIILVSIVGIVLWKFYGNTTTPKKVTRPFTHPRTNIATDTVTRPMFVCPGGGSLVSTYGIDGAIIVPNQGVLYPAPASPAINPTTLDILYYNWSFGNAFFEITRMTVDGTVVFNVAPVGNFGLTAGAMDTFNDVFVGSLITPSAPYVSRLIKLDSTGAYAVGFPPVRFSTFSTQTSAVIVSILPKLVSNTISVYLVLANTPTGGGSIFTLTRCAGLDGSIDTNFNPGVGFVQFNETNPSNSEHLKLELPKFPNDENVFLSESRSFFDDQQPKKRKDTKQEHANSVTDSLTDRPTDSLTVSGQALSPCYIYTAPVALLQSNGSIFLAVNAYYRNPSPVYIMIFHNVDQYGVTINTNIVELSGAEVYFTNIVQSKISSNCILCGSIYNPSPQQGVGLCVNMETLEVVSSWGINGFIYSPAIRNGSSFQGIAINPNDGSAMFLGWAYLPTKPSSYSFISYKVDASGDPMSNYGSSGYSTIRPPPGYSLGYLDDFSATGNGIVQFDQEGNEQIIAPAYSSTGPTGLQIKFCGVGHTYTGYPTGTATGGAFAF